MGILDSLLKKPGGMNISVKPVVSTSPADKFEADRREEIDTNTRKFSHYDKDGKLVFYHIETCDAQGRIIHKTAYNAAGGIMGDYDHTYNAEGKQLEGSWFFPDRGFLMKTENVYDSLGRLVENRRHGSEAHNAGGNRTLYYYVGDTGTIDYTEYYSQWTEAGLHNAPVYEYQKRSDDGRSLILKRYDENRALIRITDVEYDEQGHKIVEITADPDELVDFYNVFKYDGAGKQIENQRFSVKGEGKTVSDIAGRYRT